MEEQKMLIKKIENLAKICGIASEEVSFAKDMVLNKCKDKNLFICEGLWATDKLIEKNIKITHFFFNQDRLNENAETLENLQKIAKLAEVSEKSYMISEKACKKISDRDGYDEYFIVAKLPNYTLADFEKIISGNNNILMLVMDGLEQPGNIGAIMRSCDCAGATLGLVVNKKTNLCHSRLVRSSLGASFMIPMAETDITSAQEWLVKNNFKCVVTDLQATKSFKDADYSGRIAIVAGNEHTGISNSWRTVKNAESIIIPMLGSCESLNVGFASTLVAYEAGLQKFKNKFEEK